MPLSDYARPSPARIRLFLSLLLMLVLTAVFGRRRPGELGTRESLRRSSFTRVMFMDIGALSTLGGLQMSLTFDTPAGPSIIAIAAVAFAASAIAGQIRKT